MKISKDWDPVGNQALSFKKGTDYCDWEGIQPNESAIPETPGEKATNDTAALSTTKSQPFGAGGSGYTKGK